LLLLLLMWWWWWWWWWWVERLQSVLALSLWSEVGWDGALVVCSGFFRVGWTHRVVGKLLVRFGLFLAFLQLGVLVTAWAGISSASL
jgi:hypothetical protein